MADIGSAQEFSDTVKRLRAIADHINGNLLDDPASEEEGR